MARALRCQNPAAIVLVSGELELQLDSRHVYLHNVYQECCRTLPNERSGIVREFASAMLEAISYVLPDSASDAIPQLRRRLCRESKWLWMIWNNICGQIQHRLQSLLGEA